MVCIAFCAGWLARISRLTYELDQRTYSVGVADSIRVGPVPSNIHTGPERGSPSAGIRRRVVVVNSVWLNI